jgi:hypothetical protein
VKLRTRPLHAFTGDRGFESISLQRRVNNELEGKKLYLLSAFRRRLQYPASNARSTNSRACSMRMSC